MGDVLGALFGSGGKTSTNTTADPFSLAMNALRMSQMEDYFGKNFLSTYGNPNYDTMTPSPQVQQLYSDAISPVDTSKLMSFDDYTKLGLDQSRNYIQQIATPEIMSQAALQGLEGGGIVPESIAKATAGIALPFIQGLPQANLNLNMAPYQMQAMKAQTASTLFPMADYDRMLKEQDFLRQQGVMQTALTGLPFTPTSSTQERKSSQPMFNFFGQG